MLERVGFLVDQIACLANRRLKGRCVSTSQSYLGQHVKGCTKKRKVLLENSVFSASSKSLNTNIAQDASNHIVSVALLVPVTNKQHTSLASQLPTRRYKAHLES
jgi:hypothetical protein